MTHLPVEVFKRYKETPLKFNRYYKYQFYYSGETHDGLQLEAWFGGETKCFYRCEVNANEVVTFEEFINNFPIDITNQFFTITNQKLIKQLTQEVMSKHYPDNDLNSTKGNTK